MQAELPAHFAAAQDRARAEARLVSKGIGLNAVLAILKFAGGFFGHTHALIADGTESLLDVLSSILVWAGLGVAGRPPDDDHPYGHGRAEPLAALAVAGFIFLAAGAVAWRAIMLIMKPHQGPHWLTLPLLAGIITAKVLFSRRMRAAGAESSSLALGIEAWHHASDAVTSVAAFIGIAVAVAGGPGWEAADSWAALFACAIVTFNGVAILKKAMDEMMDAAPPRSIAEHVRSLAAQVPGVLSIEKCRVRKSGVSHLVDIHVCVDAGISVREGHEIAHAVKNALLGSSRGITDVSVHIEPAG